MPRPQACASKATANTSQIPRMSLRVKRGGSPLRWTFSSRRFQLQMEQQCMWLHAVWSKAARHLSADFRGGVVGGDVGDLTLLLSPHQVLLRGAKIAKVRLLRNSVYTLSGISCAALLDVSYMQKSCTAIGIVHAKGEGGCAPLSCHTWPQISWAPHGS